MVADEVGQMRHGKQATPSLHQFQGTGKSADSPAAAHAPRGTSKVVL
jgi:hypothetical protein